MKWRATTLCLGMILSLCAGQTLADDDAGGKVLTGPSAGEAPTLRPGQQSWGELDALVGSFLGLRLEGRVHSGDRYNVLVEGLYGDFLGTGLGSTAYGLGLRGEYYLSSSARHAWMISPAIDGYYVEPNPCPSYDAGQSIINSEAGAVLLTTCAIFATPTHTVLVAPKVDLDWLYQFSPHFGLTTGLTAGAAIVVSGEEYYGINETPSGTMSLTGRSIAGKAFVDVGLTVGVRF